MGERLSHLLRGIVAAERPDALAREIVALPEPLGVDHVLFQAAGAVGPPFAAASYSAEWAARYAAAGFARVDPVVQGGARRTRPVDWRRLDWSSPAARRYRAEALAAGVGRQGFAVPIRHEATRFAIFSVSADADDGAWDAFVAARGRVLEIVAHAVDDRSRGFGGAAEPATQPLSAREAEALALIAGGLSRAGAAEALSISEHTLRVYIEAARRKLGAASAAQAVGRALARGLVDA